MVPTFVKSEAHSASEDSAALSIKMSNLIRRGSTLGLAVNRKRKRSLTDDLDYEWNGNETLNVSNGSARSQRRVLAKEIRAPELIFPKSSYIGFERPGPRYSEDAVLEELLKLDGALNNAEFGGSNFTSLNFEDFSIYRPSKQEVSSISQPDEMAALHDLCVKPKNESYYIDGCLVASGSTRRYVEKVPFKWLSIGGYGDPTVHSKNGMVWIQSIKSLQRNTWYRLGKPSPEYKRFHEPFLWISNFAKYFVNFLDENECVSISSFSEDFYSWLNSLPQRRVGFQKWLHDYGDTDFRRVVTAQSEFLSKEAGLLDDSYLIHPIWDEVHPRGLNAIRNQPLVEAKTLVTPYVYSCFKDMSWVAHLKVGASLTGRHRESKSIDRVACPRVRPRIKRLVDHCPNSILVEVGDVIKLAHDKKSIWKTTDAYWYAYVQGIENRNCEQNLKILWLYKPADTICSESFYPWKNELFLSNHCECTRTRIRAEEIDGKASVTFYGSPSSSTEFFVRQRYADETFMDLRPEHFKCLCHRPSPTLGYQPGNTVLVEKVISGRVATLEPVEIVDLPLRTGKELVKVRLLRRKRRDYGDMLARLNELVYTNKFEYLPISDLKRSCHVRFFSQKSLLNGDIPVPYSRDGIGDAYYIVNEEDEHHQILRELQEPYPSSLVQGFDPLRNSTMPKLKILDLFCGGGNFGRGIEEGKVAEVRWAIDIDSNALHTYRANLPSPENVGLYLGSVNDYLSQALDGKFSELIARPGEVDVVIAGSPCQGFSTLNNNKSSEKGLRNQSMVASVAAYVDFYRPKYAILENVPGMASKNGQSKSVLAQMNCALVGMDYQVQNFTLDAWSFGSPQSRTRLFVAAAAPGMMPLEVPQPSHSHPEGVRNHSLGRVANGLPVSQRQLGVSTPLKYVTIGEATADIPYNHDGRTTSICFPDHRLTGAGMDTEHRLRISCIPRHPENQSVNTARSFIHEKLIKTCPTIFKHSMRSRGDSRCYRRTSANKLLPTVTGYCNPGDYKSGRVLHWEASRCLTVMEVRRAQSYPDRDVILGRPSQQWKIVGNSVARTVALALGMSLRAAWLTTVAFQSLVSTEDGVTGQQEVLRAEFSEPSLDSKSKHQTVQVQVGPKIEGKCEERAAECRDKNKRARPIDSVLSNSTLRHECLEGKLKTA